MGTTRRPINACDSHWAAIVDAFPARVGVNPNQISVASVVSSAGGWVFLALTGVPGAVVTVFRRVALIGRELESK